MSNSPTISLPGAAAGPSSPSKPIAFRCSGLKLYTVGSQQTQIKHKWMRQVAMET